MRTFTKILILVIVIIVSPAKTMATADYLAVNYITGEYYWGDEDNSPGWIGWNGVPETELATAEAKFIESGYERTSFPFKIESFILFLFLLIVISFTVNKKIITAKLKEL